MQEYIPPLVTTTLSATWHTLSLHTLDREAFTTAIKNDLAAVYHGIQETDVTLVLFPCANNGMRVQIEIRCGSSDLPIRMY